MRIPGTRSSMGSTILQQSSQEDERKAAKARNKQARNQQVQTGILATGNLLGDVARTIPQFQANSIRESEGAKERAFQKALEQAREGRIVSEGRLDRVSAERVAQTRSNPELEALSLIGAERTQREVDEIDRDPSIPPDLKARVIPKILSQQNDQEVQAVRQQRASAVPIQQAAAQAGIADTGLISRGEPGAFQGMDRDTALKLLGNAAINQGEDSEVVRQLASKLNYALPQRTPLQQFGRFAKNQLSPTGALGLPGIFGASTGEADMAEKEVEELLRALGTQYGPTATDRGFTSTQPLSPAARKYILSIRQQLGQ